MEATRVKRIAMRVGFFLTCSSFAFSTLHAQGRSPRRGIVPNRYIVVLRDDVRDPDASANRMARRYGIRSRFVFRKALKGFSAEMTASVLARLRSEPEVAFVEPDRWVETAVQDLPTGVNRVNADLNAIAKIDGVDERVNVDVAILDTGIDLNHPDLNVVAATNCARFGACLDGSGEDGHGHGSHVAGIVGGLDNDFGIVGVAPGARLWAVRVLNDNGGGLLSWVIHGIDWVTNHADSIEVANMSLAWQGYSAAARTAIQNSVQQGVVYTVAAGNESNDVYGADGVFGTGDDVSPAAFPEVAAISALADYDGEPGGVASASDDSMASFTNFSQTVIPGNPVLSPGAAIDLVCPGVNILSTYKNGGYAVFSGTSMASPHAAGLAALYIAENGRATNAAGVFSIRQALIDRGVDQLSSNGLASPNDPDGNMERLGWAADVGAFTDIATTSVVADPSSVTPGDLVTVTVEIRNTGTEDVASDIEVSLSADGTVIGMETILGGLVQGASAQLSFIWNTTGGSLGDHTLTASHDLVDDRPANDSASTTVTLIDSSVPVSTHIADLDGSSARTGFWFVWRANVTVTVVDNLGAPVANAGVSILWSDGSTDSLTTNANGQGTFVGFQWSWLTSLSLVVTNVTQGSLTYDPSLNTDPDGDSNGTTITLFRP